MKKISKILLIALFILAVCQATVKADSFKFNVKANKDSLKPGDTVEINLNLSDIDAGDLGINTLEATLGYDPDVFEEVTQSSFSAVNNWSLTYNSEDTENKGKILAVIVTSGVKENQDIGKITLKVKSNAKDTNTTVTLKNVASNNGQNLINETDKAITFKVVGGQTDSENNKPSTGNSSSGIIVQNNQNSGQSQGRLPQTGVENYKIYAAIAILVVMSIIAYMGYKKMKEKE